MKLSPRMKRAVAAARRVLLAHAPHVYGVGAGGHFEHDAELAADLRRLARNLPLLAKLLRPVGRKAVRR